MHRRSFLAVTPAAAGALFAAASAARAQGPVFPNRPVRIIVPFPAGGSQDTIARAMGARLAEAFRQSFVIENKVGAGGNIGADFVAKSPPDGYTMLAGGASLAIVPHLQKNLPYDPARDLAGVSLLAAGPFIVVAHPGAPFSTFDQFLAYARANPGKVTYGSQGNGSVPHLAVEWLKSLARLDLLHVPYKGAAPNVQALLAGETMMTIESAVATRAHIRAGKLRALAVTVREALDYLPDAPPVGRSVPGYELSGWQALYVPSATPMEIRSRLSAEVVRAMRAPDLQKLLRDLGTEPVSSSPAEVDSYLRAELAKWGSVVRENNIRMDP